MSDFGSKWSRRRYIVFQEHIMLIQSHTDHSPLPFSDNSCNMTIFRLREITVEPVEAFWRRLAYCESTVAMRCLLIIFGHTNCVRIMHNFSKSTTHPKNMSNRWNLMFVNILQSSKVHDKRPFLRYSNLSQKYSHHEWHETLTSPTRAIDCDCPSANTVDLDYECYAVSMCSSANVMMNFAVHTDSRLQTLQSSHSLPLVLLFSNCSQLS